MIILRNKKDNTKAMIIATSEDDEKVLQFLFDNHIVWGFYQLLHIGRGHNGDMEIVKQVLAKYPTALAIANLSSPEGFVPKYEKVEK